MAAATSLYQKNELDPVCRKIEKLTADAEKLIPKVDEIQLSIHESFDYQF